MAYLIQSFNEINSYAYLYKKEIECAYENSSVDFAKFYSLLYTVRKCIYELHRIETIMNYFMYNSITLEEAINKYNNKFITEKEYVSFMKENIQKDIIRETNEIEKEITKIENSINKYLFEIYTITTISNKYKLPIDLIITLI